VTANETAVETGSPIVVATDAATMEVTPAETSTVELPTFTPLRAAQVDSNSSPTASAPLSLTGVIVALAVAGLLVVLRRNRK
jgi:SH3-like domain-containing protein